MKKNYHLYLGKAGHLTVMSEFLTRGWNVAIPEVDISDDIFVVQDDNGTLRRVQVKTSTSTSRLKSFSGQFNVPLTQLRNIANIPVHDGNLILYFSYATGKVECSGQDLTKFVSDFSDFPIIDD